MHVERLTEAVGRRAVRKKMAFASALERNGGGADETRRRLDEGERETRGSATGFFYDDTSADDELATLMPALKRRFEAIDADEGTLNFMGELNTSNEASFHRNENKENAPQMRRKSGRKSTIGPIDFDKKFRIKTGATLPSGSLYRNITTALKENVNRAEIQSQNVDDFWASERQKKISAVVRRRMSGIKTPAGQTKTKPVEDRRRSRTRYRGVNGRRPGNRNIKWDLYLDAAKISEWDQETLAEEEVAPFTRANCGAFLSAGRPGLQDNLATLDQRQEQNDGAQQDGLEAAGRGDECQAEETKSNLPGEASSQAGSDCSLPDMEVSTGESPPVEIPDFLAGKQSTQNSLQDASSVHADLAMEDAFMPRDAVGVEAIGQIWPRGGEDLDNHLEKIVAEDFLPRDRNLEGDPPSTPLQGFPVLDSCDLQREERLAATSPTPPSNPVAVYMSLRHVEGEVRQRRLAFLSSPSSDSIETNPSREREELNSVASTSRRDSVQVGPHDAAPSEKNIEVEEVDLLVVESRRALSPGEHEFEGKRLVFGEGELLKDLCNRRELKMAAPKDDLQSDCLQGIKSNEFELETNLCLPATHQTTAVEHIAQAEEPSHSNEIFSAARHEANCSSEMLPAAPCKANYSNEILPAAPSEANYSKEILPAASCEAYCPNEMVPPAPCEASHLNEILPAAACEAHHSNAMSPAAVKLQEENEGRNQPWSEESPPVASCEREALQSTDEVRPQKDGEVERDGAGSPAYLRDDDKFVQEQTVNSVPRIPRPGGNALQALSYDYGDDDEDLEALDVKELEPLHQERNGTSLADQTEPEILVQNREESFGEVGVEKNAQISPEKVKDGEADPPGVAVPLDAAVRPDVAHGGGPIGTDEGSTTQIKPTRLPRKKAPKAKNKRSSLEGCGSLWKDGQRRSQRIRVNPVEWWRGEKLLYGRIHDSLTTVIGIKYSSRGIDTPFVVESYVPPEYDELVHFAAI